MEFKFVEKKKGTLEMEFDEREMPVALTGMLLRNGVDAYWYEPHPLKAGVRLHVDADDAQAELKRAVKDLEQDWSQLRKAVEAKLK